MLSDIKTCGAVHVMEPELLIRIVPFGAETGWGENRLLSA
jgi:hypothetical protein